VGDKGTVSLRAVVPTRSLGAPVVTWATLTRITGTINQQAWLKLTDTSNADSKIETLRNELQDVPDVQITGGVQAREQIQQVVMGRFWDFLPQTPRPGRPASFNQKLHPGNGAAELFHQLDDCLGGAAGGDHVVHHQYPLAGLDGILVNVEDVAPILERVLDTPRPPG